MGEYFQDKTEQEARVLILDLVAQYGQRYHGQQAWQPGDKIPYAGRVYDQREMVNLVDAALEFWLTAGRYTEQFEQQLGTYLGVPYCSLVNSGSSANLLAFMALTSPLLKERAIQRGDEVITVACGFPTTVTPVLQYGAVPVFVDVSIPQYNLDVTMLEQALSPKTKAVMLAHTLGNPFDVQAVQQFCQQHQLWLIEDNCDALGSRVELDGQWHYTGTIGDIGTSSFYPPHHLTMGEGGAVYTSQPLLHKIIRSVRDWGRDCTCAAGQDNRCGQRFAGQYGELPVGYDHKYVYAHFGYNLKATDLQAAVGLAQLEKLPDFTAKRQANWQYLRERLTDLEHCFVLPEPLANSHPSWFGFMLTCRRGIDRDQAVQYLEQQQIQTRMLFAGNLIKHPCFDGLRQSGTGYRIAGNLEHTDRIMQNGFWIGVYPGMDQAKLDYIVEKIKAGVKNAE